MTQTFGHNVCRSKLNSSRGPCLWPWRICPLLSTVTLRYARICSDAYLPQLQRFRQGDYVYLQREAPTTLDIRARRTIFWVKATLPSGLLLLEGKDGREYHEHSKNLCPMSSTH